jgi:hypothetical protein
MVVQMAALKAAWLDKKKAEWKADMKVEKRDPLKVDCLAASTAVERVAYWVVWKVVQMAELRAASKVEK